MLNQCPAAPDQAGADRARNVGLCNTCRARVPADFLERAGQIFIRKECPTCGPSESLVSTDAAAWQAKRELWQYVPSERVRCGLHCDHCRLPHEPTIVFVDVTNRCNMYCPICIANVRGMGFDFHPPLVYFDKLFAELGRLDPVPMVELFGGEPTVRDDLVDIVNLGRAHGLKPRIVTNGLRLADEDYCRKLCEAKVRVRLAFDGRQPEIYQRLRRNPAACEKKLKALENLKKYSRRKHALICCAARDINERHLGDLIDLCHEYVDHISELGLIPLTENWQPGEFESVERTTPEDVEQMIRRSVRGGDVEFVPAGIVHGSRKARAFFKSKSRSEMLMLGGVHPNCESMTLLVSDGEHYRSINRVLKMPLRELARELLAQSRRIEAALDRLNPRKRLDRLRGQFLVIVTYTPLVVRSVVLTPIFKGHPLLGPLRILWGLARGCRWRDLLHAHTNPLRVLRIAVLPFEEYHSIDAARLENCKASFAYEDVTDGRMRLIPACTWYLYRNERLKQISEKYGVLRPAAAHPEAEVPVPV